MADDSPLPLPTDTLPDAPPETSRRKRTRRLRLDEDAITARILDGLDQAQTERIDWMDQRLARMAKLRGWREAPPAGDYAWSNQHIPVMMANGLRVKAGLHNAVLGIRPVMQAKPLRKSDKEAADRIADLIDFQVFQEADGESKISQLIDQFVDDGTVFAYVPWVREQQKVYKVEVLRRPDLPLTEAIPQLAMEFMAGLTKLTRDDEDGYAWTATLPARNPSDDDLEVTLKVYDRDDTRIELCFEWSPYALDGPQIILQALEDVIAPLRSENLQPITAANPFGAPWVCRTMRVDLEYISRRIREGTWDFLDKSDLEDLESLASSRVPTNDADESFTDQIKAEKERLAGLLSTWGLQDDRKWLTLVEWYGRWDADDDGQEEDVIVWVLREAKRVVRARYLTELFPGFPPRRPFSESRYIPIPQMLYGMGLPELQEGLHDLLHVIFNQTIDYGTITNAPFFFYRASSGLKPEVIRLWPGEGYPLDTPQQDVYFPNLPGKDQSYGFNLIGLGLQLLDRLVQIGPLQLGQVPTGKASALRTVGTTLAILQQGAAMPEQVLRRLFHGLKQIWEQIHVLNTRFLPRQKEYLIAGKPLDGQDAYGVIETPDSIAVPITFDFQATLLNTNKGIVAQALMGIGQALVSPLLIQLRLVDPEHLYNWMKDLIQANQLDPSRYLVRPQGMPDAPRMLWEEVLQVLLNGQLPTVAPLEGAEAQLQKAQAFMQTDDFGMFRGDTLTLFREYIKALIQAVQQERQAQAMLQAASQFQQMMGQQSGQGGQGGAMTTMQPPPFQAETGTTQEAQNQPGSANES